MDRAVGVVLEDAARRAHADAGHAVAKRPRDLDQGSYQLIGAGKRRGHLSAFRDRAGLVHKRPLHARAADIDRDIPLGHGRTPYSAAAARRRTIMYGRPGSSTRNDPVRTPGSASTVMFHVSMTSTVYPVPSGAVNSRYAGAKNPK